MFDRLLEVVGVVIGSDEESVTCPACGGDFSREETREYDKHGDRWERADKDFEYVCKPCFRDLCHQPRNGLEERASEANERTSTASEFANRFSRGEDEISDPPEN